MRTEQEKTEWKNRMRGLVQQVAALTDEQRAEISAGMPIVTCEGHPLSEYNQVFLSMQTTIALTVIAGFRQWKKAQRQVRKGEHAAGYIYVPLIPKGNENEALTTDPEELHFMLVPVFDVSQTEWL